MLKHQAREHDNAAGNYIAKVTGTAKDCFIETSKGSHPHQEMPSANIE
jgi:hypothetical protein